MFTSARTAASSPLASPTLKHVVEFAYSHSPLVGLGITMGNQRASASIAPSSNMQIGHASGQPIMHRPPLQRMQTPVTITPPRTPRLQCPATLPSAFSSTILTPTGAQSPFASEGYFSDDNESSENREAIASGIQSIHIPQPTVHHRFAGTTNNMRSTFRSSLPNTYAEVDRIGLGITGISLNQGSITPNVDVDGVFSPGVVHSSPEVQITHLITTVTRTNLRPIVKSVGFDAHIHVIGLSNIIDMNINDDLDGYAADTENGDSHNPRRRTRRDRVGSTLSGARSCKGRVLTPYYAPNGETTWL